jgi:hypothetical protein
LPAKDGCVENCSENTPRGVFVGVERYFIGGVNPAFQSSFAKQNLMLKIRMEADFKQCSGMSFKFNHENTEFPRNKIYLPFFRMIAFSGSLLTSWENFAILFNMTTIAWRAKTISHPIL